MDVLVMFVGLFSAGVGHALLHDWRGFVAVYEELDERFPEPLRTPTSLAGPLLLSCGAVCALAPMLG
jgi:hypothetical protein